MKDVQSKREREKHIVSGMIALYCHKKHGTRGCICDDCAGLNAYAEMRSDR